MIEQLPLYPGSKPCVRSGYCCKKRPCGFGEWNEDQTQCAHLKGEGPGQYECGIAAEIVKDPEWKLSPAFGAGCCSPMFNEDRDAILNSKSTF